MTALGRPGLWHTHVACLAFVTLGAWPALIASDRPDAPLVLRRRSGEVLAVGLGALLLLCVMGGMDPRADGSAYGPQQRLLMTAQSLVTLVILLGVQLRLVATRRAARRSWSRGAEHAALQDWRPTAALSALTRSARRDQQSNGDDRGRASTSVGHARQSHRHRRHSTYRTAAPTTMSVVEAMRPPVSLKPG